MPLVRVEVRNEFSLGAPELYREANKEDPKEILEGVAVAGLVGVLRQLGDLAEFAAEVFHGLQEEVTVTSSRSRKLMGRVQRIEAALSPVEKAVLTQRSHLHFAYTAGTNWHTRIRCEQNHFVYSDVPQFIMDSYEDSRGPPNLHLLDRFDQGGPGSCLKRYSDPTFFRKASMASGEASTEKISKAKKTRKIKKRRSWPRKGELSRDASFSFHSGRSHFTKPDVGRTSPTQTMSTYDSTIRSDMDEQSHLDLRNGSGYIEGDFRPSYSTQPEGQESSISISSPVKKRDSDFLDYDFLEEKVTNASDDIQINQPQEQAGCSSSSVTWDGYSEKHEPTFQVHEHDGMSQEDDHDANIESFSPKWDLRSMGNNTDNFITDNKMDIQTSNQAVPTLKCEGVHLEDVDSETDNFMDALNTIESEPETDTECTIKQKILHYPELEEKAVDDGPGEVIRHNSEFESSNSELNVLANSSPIDFSRGHNPISATPESPSAAYCSGSGEAASEELNSVTPVDNALLSAQRPIESLNPSSPQSVGSRENDNVYDGTNVESVSCTVSSNFRDDISVMTVSDGTRSSVEDEKPAPETANVAPVTFWTNGSLLGLQPSKPPDWSGLNALPQDSLSNKDGKVSSSVNNFSLSDKDARKPDQRENLKKVEEGPDMEDHESGYSFRKTSWKISPADLDVKLGKPGDPLYQGNGGTTGASAKVSGSFLSVNSDHQATRKNEDNFRSSSRMFELSNTLLATGSNKKLLPVSDQNLNLAGNHKTNDYEQNFFQNVAHQTLSGRTKDLLGVDSFMLSPPDSPPLEHMKISFQPIDGFETSKLKLKFPDGNPNNESSRDIFPSFQLVPEVVTRHNVGSDSDDDTFYRSSPSLSDDCHSHHSKSNSEQWESDESPSNKDHDVYDALRRISLTDSVATGPENGSTIHADTPRSNGLQFPFLENSVQNSQSSRSYDLQSLDTLKHSFRELRNNSNLKDLVDPQSAFSPTPPLPPVQWRGMKPSLDFIEDTCATMHEGYKYAVDIKHSESTVSQQPKPAPLNLDHTFDTTVKKITKSSSLKSNGRRATNQGKSIGEKEDFLQQIRSKSFSLRPIATAKSTVPSGGSANVQVTAILEKANAIRQAVGSDGEDDSNWSDT